MQEVAPVSERNMKERERERASEGGREGREGGREGGEGGGRITDSPTTPSCKEDRTRSIETS